MLQTPCEEGARFELANLLQLLVFKTSAIDQLCQPSLLKIDIERRIILLIILVLLHLGKRVSIFDATIGFEPIQTEPKSVVLPLHQVAMGEQIVRLELTSPVWKTGALTVVLYLLINLVTYIGFEPISNFAADSNRIFNHVCSEFASYRNRPDKPCLQDR